VCQHFLGAFACLEGSGRGILVGYQRCISAQEGQQRLANMSEQMLSLPEKDRPDHTVRVQQLFVRHQSSLRAFILSLQPDFSEAEDILQEVFLVVTRKAGEFHEGSNFMGWALAIARFKVMEAIRRRTSDRALSEEVVEVLCDECPEDELSEERTAMVRACLEKLAPRLQEVMRLRYFAEHGPGEIARMLAWTPNSVNVALSRARKLMHGCVDRKLQKG
jgi:RNA polymerase sigma-70 factor (ECF subfamily)